MPNIWSSSPFYYWGLKPFFIDHIKSPTHSYWNMPHMYKPLSRTCCYWTFTQLQRSPVFTAHSLFWVQLLSLLNFLTNYFGKLVKIIKPNWTYNNVNQHILHPPLFDDINDKFLSYATASHPSISMPITLA